jgi:protein-S-isoprenylcysteine O-methyltransferase Ste14
VSLADFFHRVATGPKRRRRRLAPLGLLAFGATLALVIAGGLQTDRWLGLPELLPGIMGSGVGLVPLVGGGWLCGWCVVRFAKARGTPVPLDPPEELVVGGPYARVRNPMLAGLFALLFGLGLVLHSVGVTLIWTPAYVVLHVAELKWVEEPELLRRFGDAYAEYRDRVPMFVPRLRR